MPRSFLLFFLTCLVSAICQPVHAQRAAKVPRIGYLEPSSEGSSAYEAFQQGMLELGYVEGRNVAFEHRARAGRSRYSELVKELVQLKVDVIVTRAGGPARAAKAAAGAIPIVFAYSGDPIEAGFVASLSHPESNMTGVTFLAYELVGKRIELLKEAAPKISVVAVLANPGHKGEEREFSETQRAAHALRTDLRYHRVRTTADFDTAFGAITKEKASGLLVFPESVTMAHRKQIAEFAAQRRLPSVFGWKEFVEDGGLMSYGPKRDEVYRRTAAYVDKILKGRKPAELPVELPMKFEMVINLRTAKQIGLSIPQWTLMKADRVIK